MSEVWKDMVNHPSHYIGNGIECIDAMKACVTPEEFRAHLKLTAIKYLWRYEKKANPLEDIQKALFYMNRLEQELKNAGN